MKVKLFYGTMSGQMTFENQFNKWCEESNAEVVSTSLTSHSGGYMLAVFYVVAPVFVPKKASKKSASKKDS